MIKFATHFIIVGFLLNAGITIAQHPIPLVTDEIISLDPDVRYGQLDNGFTYYIHRNHVPTGEVELRMVIKAGYFHEDEDQLEYAHLLEHMGARGTTHFAHLPNYLKSSGGSMNAHTRNDHTYYEARIPSGNKELLKNGLQILRDWAQEISLDQESIDVERGAVLGEMHVANVYNRWLSETIVSNILENTTFQLRIRERHAANIRNFNLGSFVRFYHDWYRPDLQAAIIVGDIDVDSVEEEIKRLFTDLDMPKHPVDAVKRVTAQIKLDGQIRFASIIDSVRTDFRLYILSKLPDYSYCPKTKGDYKNMILQQVYQELLRIRINHHLTQQYDRPIDYGAYHINNTNQINVVRMAITFDHDETAYMKEKILHGVTTIRHLNTGFTENELDVVKKNIWENYSTHSRFGENNTLANNYIEHFVCGTAAPAPEVKQNLMRTLLENINLEDIHSLAREYVDLNRNTDFLFFSGGQVVVPDSSTLNNWLAEAMAENVNPYKATVQPVTSLQEVVRIPVGGSIEIASMTENLIGVTTVELSNGIKLMLKPTKAYNRYVPGSVQIRAFRPNGISLKNRSEYLAATLAPEVIKHAGAGSYTRFQLDQFRQDNGVYLLMFQMGRAEQSITGKCHPDHVEDLLQLLYLYTNVPRMDSVAFRDWKRLKRNTLEGTTQTQEPWFFESLIEQIRFPEIPVMRLIDLDQLSMEKIYTAHDRWYAGFNGYTFIVTGGFDKEQLLPILVKYLSVLPEGLSPDAGADDVPVVPLLRLDKTVYVKNKEDATIHLRFPVLAPTDTKTKILVSLLSNALYSRIYNRLRAGSYAPGANSALKDSKIGLYEFKIWFDSELGNEDNMIRYALEEFRQLRENGVDEEWFEKTIDWWKTIYGRRFDSSGFWYDYLKEKQENNEEMMAELLQYETILGHFITLDDVNAAAKELLSEEFYQQFVFLPEEY